MSEDRPPSVYRSIRVLYLVISAMLLGAAYGLVRGWPFDPAMLVLGVPLRHWGLALAFAAGANALLVLLRAFFHPGRKSIWWF